MKLSQPVLFGDGEIADAPSAPVQSCYDLWNLFAKKNGWQEAKVLDTGRRAALKRACKDYGGVPGFQAMLEKIERSDWCMGRVAPRDGRKQFKADLDWFTRPVTVRKVIEDFYNGGTPSGGVAGSSSTGPVVQDDPWRRWLSYRVGGWWPSHLGPKPDEPGCRMTPALLMNWRRENNVEVVVPKDQTEEERLTSSIVSLRRYEKWDRANAAEERLAALQKRPPVLVPAPDAAQAGMPPRAEFRPANGSTSAPMRDSQKATGVASVNNSRMGHNRPPGPITDVPFDDAPPWDDAIPEGDPAMAEP